MPSLSLISSSCLSVLSFKDFSCIFNLSASTLCFSVSRLDSESHFVHWCAGLRSKEEACLWEVVIIGVKWQFLFHVDYDLGSSECSTGILPLIMLSCNIIMRWFSFFSSRISCWAWAMASHGWTGLGSADGTGVTPGFIRDMEGIVPVLWRPRFSLGECLLDAKWEGGTRSSWRCPTVQNMKCCYTCFVCRSRPLSMTKYTIQKIITWWNNHGF